MCLQRPCRRDGEGTAVSGPQMRRHGETFLLQHDEGLPVPQETRGQRQSALPRQDEGPPTPSHRRQGASATAGLLPTVQPEVLPDDRTGFRLVVAPQALAEGNVLRGVATARNRHYPVLWLVKMCCDDHRQHS